MTFILHLEREHCLNFFTICKEGSVRNKHLRNLNAFNIAAQIQTMTVFFTAFTNDMKNNTLGFFVSHLRIKMIKKKHLCLHLLLNCVHFQTQLVDI